MDMNVILSSLQAKLGTKDFNIFFENLPLIGTLTYDEIKASENSLVTSFVNKFSNFFNGDEQKTEEFFKKLANTRTSFLDKPYVDVRYLYEIVTNGQYLSDNFYRAFQDWLKENKETLKTLLNI